MRWYSDRSDHLGDNSLSSLWSLGQMYSETLHPREVSPFKNLWEVDGSPSWCKRLRILRTARAIASPSVVAVAPQQWADFQSCRSDLEFFGIRYHSIPRGFGRISHGLCNIYNIQFNYVISFHIVYITHILFLLVSDEMPTKTDAARMFQPSFCSKRAPWPQEDLRWLRWLHGNNQRRQTNSTVLDILDISRH